MGNKHYNVPLEAYGRTEARVVSSMKSLLLYRFNKNLLKDEMGYFIKNKKGESLRMYLCLKNRQYKAFIFMK